MRTGRRGGYRDKRTYLRGGRTCTVRRHDGSPLCASCGLAYDWNGREPLAPAGYCSERCARTGPVERQPAASVRTHWPLPPPGHYARIMLGMREMPR